MIKYVLLSICFIVASCGTTIVVVEKPAPRMHANQSEFDSDLQGEYFITDSIVDWSLWTSYNEIYEPKVILETDTSYFHTVNSRMTISDYHIVNKVIQTGYMSRVVYDTTEFSESEREFVNTIVLNDYMAKITFHEEIDTLFNLNDGDLIRKYKGQYILNRKCEDGYEPILMHNEGKDSYSFGYLEPHVLADYYYSFRTKKKDLKAMIVDDAEDAVKMRNSELRYCMKNELFTLWQTIRKREMDVLIDQ
ncbi:MAG: hypothetical protein ACJA1C_001544 [Crocinitomicaceae bacterium]|jgi:hypothetical protein